MTASIPQLPESEWKKILKEIYNLKDKLEEEQRESMKAILNSLDIPLNILLIGGTGVGKSSTINAIYGANKVKVGSNPNPQTQEIEQCQISKNITLYDSPGLGEGSEKDKQHMEKIHKLLTDTDGNGNAKIDLALVITDATVKGLGQEYETIKYLLKTLGDSKRILIGLNKCDCAVSERYFDRENNKLGKEQEQFLQDKVADLQKRIKTDTGLSLRKDDIVYYSAGFYDESTRTQDKPYNIVQLEKMILSKIPKQKRVVQAAEESENAHDSNQKGFWGNVIDFVDVVTDYIPVVRDIKKVGKKIWSALTSWW
ncbi:GTPase family protein [Helicobacter cinaedi]|uniref:GTPase n=1 Tax=Helicobacter cinaedi TaxID=213 RepID=A0A377JLP4_9HELI|nr:GTPase [Helicobacter cinaedi]STP08676.1 GTPase [Helicobacter cinaedi]